MMNHVMAIKRKRGSVPFSRDERSHRNRRQAFVDYHCRHGPGINNDVLAHIFEPLYSTKGLGVGLGLPIVKQILEQHEVAWKSTARQGRQGRQGMHVVLWVAASQEECGRYTIKRSRGLFKEATTYGETKLR